MRKINLKITNRELEEQIEALKYLIEGDKKHYDVYDGIYAAYSCILKHGGVKSWGQNNIERERVANLMAASANPTDETFYTWVTRAYAGILANVLFVNISKDGDKVSYDLNEKFIQGVDKYQKEVIGELESMLY